MKSAVYAAMISVLLNHEHSDGAMAQEKGLRGSNCSRSAEVVGFLIMFCGASGYSDEMSI
jgi:hypothetical protein